MIFFKQYNKIVFERGVLMNNKLYEVKEYRDMREFINNSVTKFPNNVAFTIKTKAGKEPEYKDITYKEFKKDIDNFGAGLIKLGFHGTIRIHLLRRSINPKNNFIRFIPSARCK